MRLAALSALLFAAAASADEGKHLFILAGQSNMGGLRPEESFTPAVGAAFGADRVIVVKDAHGGQPIRRWVTDYQTLLDRKVDNVGDLYPELMDKVRKSIEGETIASVTFVWMQGERDANERLAGVYEKALERLVAQIAKDLGRDRMNVVVGRLSDFGLKTPRGQWPELRAAQEAFADAREDAVWVDTDDLNTGKNRRGKEVVDDLHLSAEGYKVLGQRFADAAIQLVKDGDS